MECRCKGGNEHSSPWKKSQSQHKGLLKLWHMPKSPDPSSTFPCYSKSIFHCSSTSPASTARQATLSSDHHQSNLCRYSTPQQTVQSHLAALHSHCVCCILSAPTVSFFFCLAFTDSCFRASLTPVLSHHPSLTPPATPVCAS